MKKYFGAILIVLLVALDVHVQAAKDINPLLSDTVKNKTSLKVQPIKAITEDTTIHKAFKPDPLKVVWMGAIIPGYGQIMNKKYWKLPLVYGGFLGFAYAISMNSSRYSTYLTAYRDIIDTDPTTNSFIAIIPKGYTISNYGGISGYSNILKSAQDNYRRYRDLSIIMSVGYYALTLVDAYVDAQLYDFDISPNLSMRFQPALLSGSCGRANTLGIQCSFSLK